MYRPASDLNVSFYEHSTHSWELLPPTQSASSHVANRGALETITPCFIRLETVRNFMTERQIH